jgi:hypothetical protein
VQYRASHSLSHRHPEKLCFSKIKAFEDVGNLVIRRHSNSRCRAACLFMIILCATIVKTAHSRYRNICGEFNDAK